jgi:hypothetical protein
MSKEKPDKFWKKESPSREIERPKKINLEGEKLRHGLAQLILTVVELLRELMEKQAIRRIEGGELTDNQVEKMGNTFIALKDEVEKLKKYFEFEDEDLNLNLGPLMAREDETGKASAVEILDKLLAKGVVVKGDVAISVAEVDLISLNLGVLLASIDKAKELYGYNASTKLLEEEVRKLKEENLKLKSSQTS